ncbi:MAG: hypothetical protein WC820_10760, partial [Spirochaetales bacterium]
MNVDTVLLRPERGGHSEIAENVLPRHRRGIGIAAFPISFGYDYEFSFSADHVHLVGHIFSVT